MTVRGYTLGAALLAVTLVLGGTGGAATTAAAAQPADTRPPALTQRIQTNDGAAGGDLSGRSTPPASSAAAPAATAFNVLQMNLCNSGANPTCYADGDAIEDAVNLIKFLRPNVVTLNEICENDLHNDLYPAFQQAWANTPSHRTYWVFAHIKQPDGSGRNVTCPVGGQPYVVAMLLHIPSSQYAGFEADYHVYDEGLQHPDDSEWRAWACAAAIGVYYACTTHLTKFGGSDAMDQCHELMDDIVPAWAWRNGAALPTVVGGDLNLRYQGNPDVQQCVPSGWFRKGDGDLQHIMATNNLTFVTSHRIDLTTSDHPAWLVALNKP